MSNGIRSRATIIPLLTTLLFLPACSTAQTRPVASATGEARTFQNPILLGMHPDPSICRVGDDYYLVNSSFEFFPGVPIYHSKDLVHWQQIGHVLSRPSQLNLDGVKANVAGIFAPTIRYHDGTFYMITTISDNAGNHNFICTATDPAGPWSDPHFLADAPGIDSSIFFDDDGTAWYTGNKHPDAGESYPKHRQIWLQKLDLKTFTLVGDKTIIEDGGALKLAHSLEGPHLYKFKDYYYLMVAEGGTGAEHAVTISRAKTITGPYETDFKNPILTHRNLGKNYPIQSTGHADLVQTQNGEWWMVLLATRPYGDKNPAENLGRETFLAPVVWESGFPIVCPNDGKVEFTEPAPNLPDHPFPALATHEEFSAPSLPLYWNFLRTPRSDFYSLTARPGFLRMNLLPQQCTELTTCSWIGRRQEHENFLASTTMDFTPKAENESAGLTAFYGNDFHYRFIKTLSGGKPTLQLIQRKAGKETLIAQTAAPEGTVDMAISARGQDYTFAFRTAGGAWKTLAVADGRILSHNAGGGYTGAYVAMYATSAGKPSTSFADFHGFDYAPTGD